MQTVKQLIEAYVDRVVEDADTATLMQLAKECIYYNFLELSDVEILDTIRTNAPDLADEFEAMK